MTYDFCMSEIYPMCSLGCGIVNEYEDTYPIKNKKSDTDNVNDHPCDVVAKS